MLFILIAIPLKISSVYRQKSSAIWRCKPRLRHYFGIMCVMRRRARENGGRMELPSFGCSQTFVNVINSCNGFGPRPQNPQNPQNPTELYAVRPVNWKKKNRRTVERVFLHKITSFIRWPDIHHHHHSRAQFCVAKALKYAPSYF